MEEVANNSNRCVIWCQKSRPESDGVKSKSLQTKNCVSIHEHSNFYIHKPSDVVVNEMQNQHAIIWNPMLGVILWVVPMCKEDDTNGFEFQFLWFDQSIFQNDDSLESSSAVLRPTVLSDKSRLPV